MFFCWQQKNLFCSDLFFCYCHGNRANQRKTAINTREPDGPPPKGKRGKATEVASSGSQAASPQQRVTGRRKSRKGGAVTRGSVTVEGQMLSQADTSDEALTQSVGQTLLQNSDESVIRRQDIASLAQVIVKYLGTVNNTAGSGQQESSSPPSERPNVTTTTTSGVPPSVTTTTTNVVPPQDTVAFNPPVLIPQYPSSSRQLRFEYQAHARLTPSLAVDTTSTVIGRTLSIYPSYQAGGPISATYERHSELSQGRPSPCP